MDNTAVQRFDSIKFYVRKSSRKFGAIEPPFAALRCPHCWKRQRFDSTKFSERKPFRKFGAIEPPPFCCQCLLWMTEQRSGSIAPNFMKGNPPENLVLSNRPSPPFAVLIVGKRSGSIAPNFLKGSPSENLVLSNRPLFVVSVCYG